ncbi:TetR/AcrR family transcriptional regulator [Deinococcus planocerae]|uniref:TetR/AcrR family transcriptional regulator n=1 Tax=Deinococcus planocerae TaxID=1737569 RepID=UPI000C7F55E4|nr:TetR/AcrR family transcriptional regulator [Deinococcus planocerae]
MGRPPNPQAKADLLQRAAAYVLEHGLTDLSLRPLAAALGVSPRLLLYHFGSKEGLVVEVLSAIAAQQQVALAAVDPAADPATRLAVLWARLTSPELTPFLRSLFEVELHAMGGDEHYRHFARGAIAAWLGVVAAHLREDVPGPTVNVVLAALTGLLIDRFSTGDEERTDEAFRALKDALHAGGLL